MLEKIDQLSSEVSNIIIYSRSAILQNLLTKKIKDRFKIEKYRTVYVDTAAELKEMKLFDFDINQLMNMKVGK